MAVVTEMLDPPAAALTAQEQQFMRALARALVYVPRVFEADLGRDLGMSTSEYFTLMHLSEASEQRLRMGELAQITALTFGAVTRVVGRLESQGLVVKRPCAGDGRGYEAALTDAGRDRLDEARPAHLTSLRRRIFSKLDDLDLETCTAVLSRIGHDDEVASP